MIRALFLYFVLFCSLVSGQRVSSVWYDTENGLPQNSVKDIVQDKYGFIWLSTENGLAKYDGNLFQIKNNLGCNNNRFSNFGGDRYLNQIYAISAYHEDIVLISGMNARKVSFSKHHFLRKKGNEIYYDYVKNGLPIEANKIKHYISLKNEIYYLDQHSITIKKKNGAEMVALFNLWENYTDDLFCINRTIYLVSRKLNKIISISGGNVSYLEGNELFYDKNAKLYWSKVNNQTFLVKDNVLYSVFWNGRKLDLKKIVDYDFNKDSVSSLFYNERLQILFVGTTINGLNVLKINQFNVVSRNNNNSVYYSLLPIDRDKIVTPAGDVFSKEGFFKNYHLGDNNKYFLCRDSLHNIYSLRDDGLRIFYKKNDYQSSKILVPNKNITYFNTFNSFSVVAFSDELGHKNILALYKEGDFKTPTSKVSFPAIVSVVKQLNAHELLIGTRKGVYVLDIRTHRSIYIKYKKNLQVRDIKITRAGDIWIMTYGDGFYLYRNYKLLKMPLDDLGRLSTAHSIQEDNNGSLWISSNNGLFRINKESLLKYGKFPGHLYYYRYTKDDGFLTNEFNGGGVPSSVQLENGELVFPSMNGIVFFNPKEIKSHYPDNFYITTVRIADHKGSFKNNHLKLANNFYKAEVYIDVPYFSNPENLIIEGKIESSKNLDWEKINTRKWVIMGLDPGEYQLVIRALSSDRGTYVYKKIKISVAYLFYQTILFKIFLVISIFVLVLIIIKFRIRKQQLKNFELEKIIEIRTEKLTDTVKKLEYTKERLRRETKQQQKLLETISHDVITPAKYLATTTKKLFETEEDDLHKIKQYFEVLYKSSEEFYNFIKTLKDYAEIYRNNNENTEEFSLNEVVESKIMLFDEIAKANNTIIQAHFKRDVQVNSNKNVISIIIHNLIDNAVKNTRDGFIDVFVEKTHDSKIVIIKDSGNGMTKEQVKYYNELQKNNVEDKLILQKYGLGLHLVLQLLMMIDGELQYAQNFPKGTTVIIKIKNISYE